MMPTPKDNSPIEVEYRDNNRIQIIHVHNMTRAAVDAYAELLQEEIIKSQDKPSLVVHNYASVRGFLSPYFIGRVREIASNSELPIHKINGRIGLVTTMDMFNVLFNPILRGVSQNVTKVNVKFFRTVDEAVEWVSQYQD